MDEDKAGSHVSHPFLNTRQASHYLGLSVRYLERMRAGGKGCHSGGTAGLSSTILTISKPGRARPVAARTAMIEPNGRLTLASWGNSCRAVRAREKRQRR